MKLLIRLYLYMYMDPKLKCNKKNKKHETNIAIAEISKEY
jgi:hypothetical protein